MSPISNFYIYFHTPALIKCTSTVTNCLLPVPFLKFSWIYFIFMVSKQGCQYPFHFALLTSWNTIISLPLIDFYLCLISYDPLIFHLLFGHYIQYSIISICLDSLVFFFVVLILLMRLASSLP